MAFNTFWRPLPSLVDVRCDYNHLPYRFRQKMTMIQSFMIDLQRMSKIKYKLLLLDDGCVILDPLNNKLLCSYDYFSPMVLFLSRLESLWQFWRYENNIDKFKNRSEINWFRSQKQIYYGR